MKWYWPHVPPAPAKIAGCAKSLRTMRAFPVSVPQAGRVRLAWFHHQTGAVVVGGKSRAPASSRAGGSRRQSPEMSP